MDPKLEKEINEGIIEIYKKHKGINGNDFAKALNNIAQHFLTLERDIVYDSSESEYKYITESDKKDLNDLWNSFIQQFIDFMNTHENVMNEVKDTKKRLTEDWSDMKMKMEPDIRFYLGADGLDYSIEKGEWTPATDSFMSIDVANETVVNMF